MSNTLDRIRNELSQNLATHLGTGESKGLRKRSE